MLGEALWQEGFLAGCGASFVIYMVVTIIKDWRKAERRHRQFEQRWKKGNQ